jgi:hypothetical protein
VTFKRALLVLAIAYFMLNEWRLVQVRHRYEETLDIQVKMLGVLREMAGIIDENYPGVVKKIPTKKEECI